MSVTGKVLILGGYGTFGSRISRRLALGGVETIIVGRVAFKAADYAAQLESESGTRCEGVSLDVSKLKSLASFL